ncbi:DNA binding domain-containing protein, excisionase family [Nocardioides scoriae]|uniref:DNA binding domain-containing protein, excisionase family n=1 Tax=Nocardioides scoriae TaxID=642780 RepID=A0A1H1LPL7_9ACTN|nr:DNA binding domain-containing protein, excisionase family [Nocardioides scoriae]
MLSVTHAAEQLDCSRGHIYGLIAAGRLPVVEIAATGTRTKTRIRAEDLEALIEGNTRRAGAPVLAWPDVLPPRPDLYPHAALGATERATYGTTEAAERLQVRARDVTDGIADGDLHAHRDGDRGRWRIDHACLMAWQRGDLCEHRKDGDAAR